MTRASAPCAVPDGSAQSAPKYRDVHLFRDGGGGHLFLVDGSRLFDLDDDIFERFVAAADDQEMSEILRIVGLASEPRRIGDHAPENVSVRALSLAIAQKCNLGCTYCYAQEGSFGSTPKNMAVETALASVDLLIAQTSPDERINLAFLGGEPLVNRMVLRQATEYASARARERDQAIGFSITTNGTLVEPDDAEFFDRHGFAVTVSLDGPAPVHDRLRPFKNGRGSFERIVERIRPLLARQGRMQTTARVTVTPDNLGLRQILDELLDLGFHSVGFSPMLASPSGRGEMDRAALQAMLAAMIECGEEFERRTLIGERYAFANVLNALSEIHRGSHRPYPCGAGGGYLGVSADGNLAACHRFVGDADGGMGTIANGIDHARKSAWLQERHVHRQSPCADCWARYLCGGGCYHEVNARGRPACEFIRGWLHFVLRLYLRLTAAAIPPSLLAEAGTDK